MTLPYEKDQYGKFVLKSETLSAEIIQNTLPGFLADVSETHPGCAVQVNVSYQHAALIPLLKEIGFDFFYSNSDYAFWVYRNGSSMPERAIISSLRAHIFLIKDNHVLLTEQKNNRDVVGMALLPGGNVNLNELPYDAGIREVREETGLTTGAMDLMGILVSTNLGPQRTTNTSFYYVCRDFTGTLVKQESEIDHLFWAPLHLCASEQTYQGLLVSHYNVLAQHILGCASKMLYSSSELNFDQPGYLQLV